MPSIPQEQALSTVNNLLSLAQTTVSVYNQMVALDQYWTDNGIANMLAAGVVVVLAILNLIGDKAVGRAEVVLVAVTSCLNSALYTASRMLFVLAARREAPARLVNVTRRGVPAAAILTSVRKNKAVRPVAPEAYLLYGTSRLLPQVLRSTARGKVV